MVYSAGIGPARRIFQFKPNNKIESFFYVNPDSPSKILLTAEGATSPYIKLKESEMTTNGLTKIDYTINLPGELESGTYSGGISVTFLPLEEDTSQISARVSVVHQVWIVSEEEKNLITFIITNKWLFISLIAIIIAFFTIKYILLREEKISEDQVVKLREYIKDAKLKNISDELIKAQLINVGWPKKLVEGELKK